MAKIEMDISEYEALKKNAELAETYAQSLEKSKKEIFELNAELQKKDKERIKELEDSTKSVTYIKKEIREEVVLVRRGTDDTMDRLLKLALSVNNARHSGMDGAGYSYGARLGALNDAVQSHIIDTLFEKQTMTSTPVYEVIEKKNLDDVISEIRLAEKEKIAADVKEKLSDASFIRSELNKSKAINTSLESKITELVGELATKNDLQLEYRELQHKFFVLNQKNHDVFAILSEANVLNAFLKIREAKSILMKKDKPNGEDR